MDAIRTKFLGPTNNRGPRIKASCSARSIIIPFDYANHNLEKNHKKAAAELIIELGWNEPEYGTLVSGYLPDGSYCHVLTGRDGKGN